jgi:hypothetical protein
VPGELYSAQMANQGVTVNLPAPIAVTGNIMGLVLNLDASKSTPFTGACPTSLATIPQSASVFDLTPMTIAAQPSNSANGMAFGLHGIIASVASGGAGITVDSLSTFLGSLSWTVTVNNATTMQGGLTPGQLAAGAVIEMDVAIQQDGSLLATRLAQISANLPNLTVASGPLLNVTAPVPVILVAGTTQEGLLAQYMNGSLFYNFATAAFQTSGQIGNLSALPFSASFNAGNMVAGQRVLVSTQAAGPAAGGPAYTPLTQLTLLPQTIDGTVTGYSSEGNFTTYTVQLATYDLFPVLAVQPGQTTLLTSPDEVTVYVDGNTQMLNSSAVDVGSVARFYGLVFNDNGTLRMDCSQVNDGVSE